jgi:hypothetical protein
MERRYREGDAGQLDRLIETLRNEQYPYGTRKKAAQALGAIGDPKAVPALIEALFDADPRDGLEIEVAHALAKIKDGRAIQPLSRLTMSSQSSDLRKATVMAIGMVGGTKATDALIDVLAYYAVLEAQQRIRDRQRLLEGFPPQRGYGGRDTTGIQMTPSVRGQPYNPSEPIGMFGEVIPTTGQMGDDEAKSLAEERRVLMEAFVAVGEPAVPVLIDKLGQTVKLGELDIRDGIQEILSRLTPAPALKDTVR